MHSDKRPAPILHDIEKIRQAVGLTPPQDPKGYEHSQPNNDEIDHLDDLVDLSPISMEEFTSARLTPRCVVHNLLYADVRTRISAGGTGKTTVALYEMAVLALGRDLWGQSPDGPCRSALVTREDRREILVARLRHIAEAMNCTRAEVMQILENVRIIDVTSLSFRLSCIDGDVVIPHARNINWLNAKLKGFKPDWMIFDPLVSFGVGESRVNDAEQGLIEAFRIFRNQTEACIEGVHHSGKANARDKTLDQYSGRGGSALSDGCRMVAVMQPLDADEWASETGDRLEDGQAGIVMALPKLSYAPQQEAIYIKRTGYKFEQVTPSKRTPEQKADAIANQVEQFIRYEYQQGRRYSQADMEAIAKPKLGLTRDPLRAAVTALKVSGRIVYHHENGKSGSHFEPVTFANDYGDGADKSEEKEVSANGTAAT